MKALSLHQPYATLVAAGLKEIETRTWPTSYRGPLVICSTKRVDREALAYAEMRLTARVDYDRLMEAIHAGLPMLDDASGQALAVVDVLDCRRLLTSDEGAAWFYAPSRWAWLLAKPRRFPPVAVRGYQRIWTIADDVVPRGVV